jgi:hypothetical protein
VVGNNLKHAHISFKRGIDTFIGAVNGNGELKKRLTQNARLDIITNAQDIIGNNIMLDFKTLCSTSNIQILGRKVWRRRGSTTGKIFQKLPTSSSKHRLNAKQVPFPRTIGLAEEILNRYRVNGSGCTGSVFGKH